MQADIPDRLLSTRSGSRRNQITEIDSTTYANGGGWQ